MSAPAETLCGVVISAGKMMRAVKVRTARQVYNSFLRKHFVSHHDHLVSDPRNSLHIGDVVKIARERRISRHIYHVVDEIVVPWGPSIEERPPVMGREERLALWRERKEKKMERRRIREGGTMEDETPVQGMVEGTAVAS